MDEAAWLNATDPAPMLAFLRGSGKATNRKLRLFAVACCRRIWPLLTDERSRRAVEALESYTERATTIEELSAAACAAQVVAEDQESTDNPYAAAAAANAVNGDLPPEYRGHGAEDENEAVPADPLSSAKDAAFAAAWAAGHAAYPDDSGDDWFAATKAEETLQCQLLRDIFGNPFAPQSCIDPSCLTPSVLLLAQRAYDDRTLPSGELSRAHLVALAAAWTRPAAPTPRCCRTCVRTVYASGGARLST
jgi:hypothetical protein